ncbi:hypothetical protein HO173_005875 [Letharia columbiana]|uniref:C3H1-type domain-containing protein n=1 Tax=Letharia columbiana TaxID=112416 RepID=A0A8H6FWZ2_9LECA|nr:uncharacterized protein HO173_005875 [Letharia columbiana]KAF6236244.1 hypothetical protein HO173_005875 [Letharia columbiana]
MPPKKEEKKAKPSSTKVVADKTFGMKNKKGAQAQKQIQQIQTQAAQAKTPDQKRKEADKAQREKDKAASEQAKRETAELFKPVQVQKVPFGVDPKTVVCTFYKQGNCEKGKKCKFSHDLSVERKGEKKNLYQDTREGEDEAKKKDDMAEWDEEKLRQVVMSKHGNPKTTTDKVCKYFTSAVEEGKYGWFWTCPNGGDKCMYKHSLPPGFVLKTKEQRAAEKALMDKSPLKTLTLEDFLESERHKLTGTLTPVTPESFAKWKKERLDKKAAEDEARQAKEATGRAMFEKGGWEDSEEEDESEEEDQSEEEDDAEEDDAEEDDAEDEVDEWDMESMRRETERIREENEKKRLEGVGGQAAIETNGVDGQGGEEDEAEGVKEEETNGLNGHADDT